MNKVLIDKTTGFTVLFSFLFIIIKVNVYPFVSLSKSTFRKFNDFIETLGPEDWSRIVVLYSIEDEL